MLAPPSASPFGPGRIFLIFVAALLALNYGIPAFFGAMPLIDQLGRFICGRLFGI